MKRKANPTPEGVYYRRGLTALAAGALLMAWSIAGESHGTGAAPAGSIVAVWWSLAAVIFAVAAIFMVVYTRSIPSVLRMRYARRHGSLAGWDGYRRSADAVAARNAGNGLSRLLVRVRTGTWS